MGWRRLLIGGVVAAAMGPLPCLADPVTYTFHQTSATQPYFSVQAAFTVDDALGAFPCISSGELAGVSSGCPPLEDSFDPPSGILSYETSNFGDLTAFTLSSGILFDLDSSPDPLTLADFVGYPLGPDSAQWYIEPGSVVFEDSDEGIFVSGLGSSNSTITIDNGNAPVNVCAGGVNCVATGYWSVAEPQSGSMLLTGLFFLAGIGWQRGWRWRRDRIRRGRSLP